MDHAITLGNVLWVIVGIGAVGGFLGAIFFIIWLMNPFRTGH